MLNVNWSAFLKGIFLTLQGHDYNNGTNGGRQLSGGAIKLLSLLAGCLWPISVAWAIVCLPIGIMSAPKLS